MAKYEWSEVFMSIEGEAKYNGHPTVYIRFARCNFKCKGFNNPEKQYESDGYATLGFDPKDYKSLQSLPLITRGCDSQYAVNPKFSHIWHKGDEKELAAQVLEVLPHNSFVNPHSGQRVILSLTGGEPTLRLKTWLPLLEELYQHGMRHVLIETNAAVPLREKDIQALYEWVGTKDSMIITWSNSPKIGVSGEVWEEAIRPEIALAQVRYNDISAFHLEGMGHTIEQYFKFVCDAVDEDFDEVEHAMRQYFDGSVYGPVYIMPVACTEEQQQEISAKVATMCMERGYIYCHRIQNSVFGNGVGT